MIAYTLCKPLLRQWSVYDTTLTCHPMFSYDTRLVYTGRYCLFWLPCDVVLVWLLVSWRTYVSVWLMKRFLLN